MWSSWPWPAAAGSRLASGSGAWGGECGGGDGVHGCSWRGRRYFSSRWRSISMAWDEDDDIADVGDLPAPQVRTPRRTNVAHLANAEERAAGPEAAVLVGVVL